MVRKGKHTPGASRTLVCDALWMDRLFFFLVIPDALSFLPLSPLAALPLTFPRVP